jgi:hypothetical protein
VYDDLRILVPASGVREVNLPKAWKFHSASNIRPGKRPVDLFKKDDINFKNPAESG